MALAREAKANLHPLAFYTIEFTSPKEKPCNQTWRSYGIIIALVAARKEIPGYDPQAVRSDFAVVCIIGVGFGSKSTELLLGGAVDWFVFRRFQR
jgi:hypothetical protein